MLNKIKSLYCKWVVGHNWDSSHGYRELPNDGATCRRCHYQYGVAK